VARSFLTQDGSVAVVLSRCRRRTSTHGGGGQLEGALVARPRGQVRHTRCDTGRGRCPHGDRASLDPWSPVPGLARFVGIGRLLAADGRARAAYDELVSAPAFVHPVGWDDVRLDTFDGLLLPGGHRARGMRRYLESDVLRELVVAAFTDGRPVGAICHGVLLAARSTNPATGRSVLFGKQTTALTWSLEQRAWRVGRLTRFWDPGYYRTYEEEAGQPAGYMSVEQEVTRALERPEDFLDVVPGTPDAAMKSSGRVRDTRPTSGPRSWWRTARIPPPAGPADAHTFARKFAATL